MKLGEAVYYFYSKRPDLQDLLLPEQIEMFKDLLDFKIKSQALSCGRGFGKTMLAGCAALYFADEYSRKIGKKVTVLLISAQKQIYDRIDEFFTYDKTLKPRLRIQPSATSGYEIPRERFEFADTKSVVYNCLPTIKQIEGIRADVIIFDEAQDILQSIYEKAIGCLKVDVIGKLIIIGTPYWEGKGSNWFIDIVSNPKKHGFKLSQFSSEICRWNDVDRWKQVWSEARIEAELRGNPPRSEQRAFFASTHLNKNIIETDPIRQGGVNSKLEVGIDWGYEKTVYTLIERIGITCNILYQKVWENTSIEILVPEIVKLLGEHKPLLVKADSLPIEYRGKVDKYTRIPIYYIDCAKRETTSEGKLISAKEHMMGQLQKKNREHHLIISQIFVDLIMELRKYKPNMDRGDDRVDSLALANYEPSEPLRVTPIGRLIFPKNMNRRYNLPSTRQFHGIQ